MLPTKLILPVPNVLTSVLLVSLLTNVHLVKTDTTFTEENVYNLVLMSDSKLIV